MATTYRIADEPNPGPMAHMVVNPMWPLLALMLGGVWLAMPWFVFNGIASGSPNRKREIGIAIGGVFVMAVVLLVIVFMADSEIIAGSGIRYAFLALTLVKLGTGYLLYVTQRRSFALYEYYGGVVRNGLGIVILGFIVGPRLLDLVPWPLVRIILS